MTRPLSMIHMFQIQTDDYMSWYVELGSGKSNGDFGSVWSLGLPIWLDSCNLRTAFILHLQWTFLQWWVCKDWQIHCSVLLLAIAYGVTFASLIFCWSMISWMQLSWQRYVSCYSFLCCTEVSYLVLSILGMETSGKKMSRSCPQMGLFGSDREWK